MVKKIVWLSIECRDDEAFIGVFEKKEDALQDFYVTAEEYDLNINNAVSMGEEIILNLDDGLGYISVESRPLM